MPFITINSNTTPSSEMTISEVEIVSALSFTPSFESNDIDDHDVPVVDVVNKNDPKNDESVCESTVEDVDEDDHDESLTHSLSDECLCYEYMDEYYQPIDPNVSTTKKTCNMPKSAIRRRSCMSIRTLEESMDEDKRSLCMMQARERRSLRFENRPQDLDVNVDVYDELRSSLAKFVSRDCDDKNENQTDLHDTTANADANARVSFSSVNIQLYPIILGFNPAVSRGPPITMDWDPFAQCSLPVETYETKRTGDGDREGESQGVSESSTSTSSSSNNPRRRKKDLKISAEERFDILKRCGEEYEIIRHRTKEIKWIQDYRNETVAKSHSKFDSDMEEKMEGIKKKCKKILLGSEYADKMRSKKVMRENKRVDKAEKMKKNSTISSGSSSKKNGK